MTRALLLFLILSLAAPALAQTVTVRSGAHDGFDRLVIDLPRRLDYRIEPREGGASLVFDARGLRFDLAAVFTRIDRARLSALAAPAGQGLLRLDLACDCALRPFWHGSAMLVLDIADPPSPAPLSTAIPRLAVPSPAARALAARLGPVPAQDAPADVATETPPTPDLDRMRSVLVQQLGRAASQGLVTAATDARQLHRAAPPPPSARAPAQEATDSSPAHPESPVALRAQTSMDRDVMGRRAPGASSRADPACPEPELLDVPAWGDPDGLPTGMGRLYRALYGEFDAIHPPAAQNLARLYIHLGFGAEARQILSLVRSESSETRLLRDLAHLVDQEPLPEGTALREATGCGEPTVLWALLARGRIDAALTFDHAALQRSFAALPEGLRRALGPGLVRHLMAVGHVNTADQLQRLIDRVAVPGEAATGLARANLAAHGAGPDLAALAEVSRSNSPHAAEALALAIETALARGAPVTVAQAQLAGAYALELRDTAMGDRLAVAHVAALASAGAFDEAATEFDRLAPNPAHPLARAMAERILREATRAADDLTFLRYVLANRFMPPEAMTDALAAAISRRLLDAGFPDAADRVLTPGRTAPELRLLRAEIALARLRPAEAELALVALDGPEADRLRARARSLRGDHATAQALFVATDALPEADRAALLSRDPVALVQAGDPLLREVGQLLSDLPDPVQDTLADAPETFVRSAALLAQTETARATLTRLLAETAPPDSRDP